LTDINPPESAWAPAVQPWSACPAVALQGVVGLFTDIDDTLTKEGSIEPEALLALHALRDAGIVVLAVTGRPMGWSRPFARDWPVAAIVAENGAVALRRDATQPDGLHIQYSQDAATREANGRRLQAVAARVLGELPHARLAQDSPGRVTDIAIDHSEHAHLDEADIERVVALMQDCGMHATVSSIHINGWFGEHTKWSGACWMLQELLGRDLPAQVQRWIFVGDSTNDQLMFERFPLSVGVANLMRFADRLHSWPAYLTAGERGAGFAEVAQALLAARRDGRA
jgi:HAD superfamily hydrolase (TIGR01484 family)